MSSGHDSGSQPDERIYELPLPQLLRRLRRQAGLSQRDLVAHLHFASHSAVVDYEAGRRIPPPNVLQSYERVLNLPAGSLSEPRRRALARRADSDDRSRGASDSGKIVAGPFARVTPRQLSARARFFTGRARELIRLDRLADGADCQRGAVLVCVLFGAAGIGKTALALQWAHNGADRFPDGQLFVNLRGFDPAAAPVSPFEAIRLIIDAFAVPPSRVPAAPEAQTAMYRSILALRKMLVLLDMQNSFSPSLRPPRLCHQTGR